MADDEFNCVTVSLRRPDARALLDLLLDVLAGHPVILDDHGFVVVIVAQLRRGLR